MPFGDIRRGEKEPAYQAVGLSHIRPIALHKQRNITPHEYLNTLHQKRGDPVFCDTGDAPTNVLRNEKREGRNHCVVAVPERSKFQATSLVACARKAQYGFPSLSSKTAKILGTGTVVFRETISMQQPR